MKGQNENTAMDYQVHVNGRQVTVELRKIKENREAQYERYCEIIHAEVTKKTQELVGQLVDERKEQGLTQRDMAELTGVATSNIARFETKKTIPTFQFLEKYARALGKTIEYRLADMERVVNG